MNKNEFEIKIKRNIRLTHTTFVVSIPKIWLNGNNLNKGSVVIMTLQKDGSLLITPEKFEHTDSEGDQK